MRRFRIGRLTAFLLCLAGLCVACVADVPAHAAVRDDVNIYCEGVWSSLDPFGTGCTTYVNMNLINQFYEALLYVSDSGELEPRLAESWSPNDDATVYTFRLRKGVKFHNGEEMKAKDVVYSFKRAMSEASLQPYYMMIDKVEAGADDYTVIITLKYAFAPFLSYMGNFMVVSEAYASQNSLLDTECGTGPYRLVDIEMNTECNMTRFDDYWRGPASIKNAKVKVITEGTTAVTAFEAGELDFMFCFNVSAFAPLKESGQYNTQLSPTYHTAFILMNNKVPPLDNKLVRQALSYATDRDTMITVAYEGLASPTYLMANTSTFGVPKDKFYNHYEYNLAKAKELLAQAGYPNGLDLGIMTVISGSYHEKYAQVFQQSLAEIGVTIALQGSESAVADADAHNYVLCTMGGGFTTDFAFAVKDYYVPINMLNYSNDKITELAEKAAGEKDKDTRLKLYEEIVDIVFDECPDIPIFNKQIPWVWAKDLNAVPHMNSGRGYYIYEMSWKQ
ncbi:ABC transporter substrate-binding protein [uncultured Fretibacterium sp.]|uniref:ABC transporter substrate-binding protein n=1 Tax=uncultured Fretibacterium sp. TaxID=1678694 RepID=UPI0026021060|nr:ABC transporter substrate-binding protein [uncultured Fretibacterium sp.]